MEAQAARTHLREPEVPVAVSVRPAQEGLHTVEDLLVISTPALLPTHMQRDRLLLPVEMEVRRELLETVERQIQLAAQRLVGLRAMARQAERQVRGMPAVLLGTTVD